MCQLAVACDTVVPCTHTTPYSQPREGKPDGSKSGAESLDGVAFPLCDWRLGFTMEFVWGNLPAGVVGCGGCCGH